MITKQERRRLIASLSGKGLVEYGGSSRTRKPRVKQEPKPVAKRERQPARSVSEDEVRSFFSEKERADALMRNALMAADHNAKAKVAP